MPGNDYTIQWFHLPCQSRFSGRGAGKYTSNFSNGHSAWKYANTSIASFFHLNTMFVDNRGFYSASGHLSGLYCLCPLVLFSHTTQGIERALNYNHRKNYLKIYNLFLKDLNNHRQFSCKGLNVNNGLESTGQLQQSTYSYSRTTPTSTTPSSYLLRSADDYTYHCCPWLATLSSSHI